MNSVISTESKLGRGSAPVDFNTIPVSAIKRIEVLRDGASAQYGSDAIAGVITFEEVGRELPPAVVTLPYQKPDFEDGRVRGNIEILDPQYGNIWTNIDRETFRALGLQHGDRVTIEISRDGERVLQHQLLYQPSFGAVPVGDTLLYLNSLNKVSLAINQGNFAETYDIGAGPGWGIVITPAAE